jgi:rSAM/selenodomain-associated transferase 2
MKLSIIIPTLNEGENILPTLTCLDQLEKHTIEIILVDGGSQDNTLEISRPYVDTILTSGKGRARQMNLGAKHASGHILWFLHADSLIPDNADQLIINNLQQTHYAWGRFNIQLSGSKWVFRIIERFINTRSRLTSIATGDQGIFVLRKEFEKINGYADIPLMEDIELSKQLKKISSPACLKQTIMTSSRRWESNGIIKTVMLMWYLRFAYFTGTPAAKLAQLYKS